MFIVTLLILLQLLFLTIGIWKIADSFVYVYSILTLISLFVVVYIVSTEDNPSYKLAWTIPVLSFPVFGGLFYLIFGLKKTTKRFREKILKIHNETEYLLDQDEEVLKEIYNKDKHFYNQAKYLKDYASSPIYKNTITEYLSPGEEFFRVLVEELKKARHYILLEYFIIEEGKMWDEILEILEEKVSQGVDVRLIYDDMGCLTTLHYKYYEKLREKGIKTVVFNPSYPFYL